jgi:hypothetical protein
VSASASITFARGDLGFCQYDGRGLATGGLRKMRARDSMVKGIEFLSVITGELQDYRSVKTPASEYRCNCFE